MGKTLDQLKLSDAPLRSTEPLDPRGTDWYRFARDIDDLLATGQYEWASSTLSDIAESVEKFHTVIDGQRRAVANIEAARGRGGSRRYEGFRGRRY